MSNPFAFVNGAETLGLTNAITPADLLHVTTGENVNVFSYIFSGVYHSTDSILSLGTDILGLSMGPSILLTSFLIKAFFTPFSLPGQYYSDKNSHLMPKLKELEIESRIKKGKGMTRQAELIQFQIDAIKRRAKMSIPAKIRFLEIPFHIFAVSSIGSKIAALAKASSVGGLKFLWIKSLLAFDPFFVTPALMSLLTFFYIKETGKNNSMTSKALDRKILYAVPAITFVITAFAPSYLSIYGLGIVAMSVANLTISRNAKIQKILWGESAAPLTTKQAVPTPPPEGKNPHKKNRRKYNKSSGN